MAASDPRIKRVLVTAAEVDKSAAEVAKWIDRYYAKQKPILLGLLKGCVPFFNRVLLRVKCDCETDFIYVNSFLGQTQAQGKPELVVDAASDFKDRTVVIIEDVIDSARTLQAVKQLLLKRGARHVGIATLLDKPTNRAVDLNADFSCHKIPNVFVVGMGLDYEEKFRNLPFVGELNEWVYQKK